ncbi:hypothetical protein AK972_3040 [Pseudomonas yamanorum]|nr:hypothetical protein AK972_3040 [Pseudomonas yamanorum]
MARGHGGGSWLKNARLVPGGIPITPMLAVKFIRLCETSG